MSEEDFDFDAAILSALSLYWPDSLMTGYVIVFTGIDNTQGNFVGMESMNGGTVTSDLGLLRAGTLKTEAFMAKQWEDD